MPPMTTGVSRPAARSASDHGRGQREVGAVVHGDADHVDVLLGRHGGDGLGRLAQSGVDHLAAGVAQDARHDAQAAVVAVEAHLGHEHPQRPIAARGRHVQATWRST